MDPVLYVHCELRDGCRVTLLANRTQLSHCEHGEGPRCMIHISHEGVTFKQEMEMMGCLVQGQQLPVKNIVLALAISQFAAKRCRLMPCICHMLFNHGPYGYVRCVGF